MHGAKGILQLNALRSKPDSSALTPECSQPSASIASCVCACIESSHTNQTKQKMNRRQKQPHARSRIQQHTSRAKRGQTQRQAFIRPTTHEGNQTQ